MVSTKHSGGALGGLEVEQVAGVHAALNEKIPLEKVLAQERIDPVVWGTADRAWREALVDAPDLQLRYGEKLRQAEDALGRPSAPYDSTPEAWAGLTAAVATSDDVAALVAGLGLSMTDFARLGRLWRRKAEKDPAVVDTLKKLAGRGTPPKPVTLGPVELKPFPWSPTVAPSAAPKAGPRFALGAPVVAGAAVARLSSRVDGKLPIELDLDLYAALTVLLELAPTAKPRALALVGLGPSEADGVLAAWRDRLKDPAVDAEFSVKKLDHRISLKEMLGGARPLLG